MLSVDVVVICHCPCCAYPLTLSPLFSIFHLVPSTVNWAKIFPHLTVLSFPPLFPNLLQSTRFAGCPIQEWLQHKFITASSFGVSYKFPVRKVSNCCGIQANFSSFSFIVEHFFLFIYLYLFFLIEWNFV